MLEDIYIYDPLKFTFKKVNDKQALIHMQCPFVQIVFNKYENTYSYKVYIFENNKKILYAAKKHLYYEPTHTEVIQLFNGLSEFNYTILSTLLLLEV